MGNPVLDLSHVLTCLNKVLFIFFIMYHQNYLVLLSQLDAGTDERIMLVARDEQSCLVVSYKEIKACVASAFK